MSRLLPVLLPCSALLLGLAGCRSDPEVDPVQVERDRVRLGSLERESAKLERALREAREDCRTLELHLRRAQEDELRLGEELRALRASNLELESHLVSERLRAEQLRQAGGEGGDGGDGD